MTCVEYIKILRLNNAANMLKETDESILQIAHTCGFFNLSLFNREFKRYYSITPSLYRKKYKCQKLILSLFSAQKSPEANNFGGQFFNIKFNLIYIQPLYVDQLPFL